MILTVVTFLVVLAVLVFVHELGHFLAAKLSGVRVDEFSVGFPPRIFEKICGETKYSIGCVPFGGFVKIFGENGEEGDRAFVQKNRLIQFFILIAGILANVIFGWLLFSIALMSGLTISTDGAPAQFMTNERIAIMDVISPSPAASAGFSANESIVSANGKAVSAIADVQNAVKNSKGSPVQFSVKEIGGTIENISVTPAKDAAAGNYEIGIEMDTVGEAHIPFFSALYDGARLTRTTIENIFAGFYSLVADAFKGRNDLGSVSGPVGIAKLVGEAEQIGFAYLLSFTAFISLNLAVINLVPFPALDGGRILFVVIEAIRRKNISAKTANAVNSVGFAILLVLLLVVTIKDVLHIL